VFILLFVFVIFTIVSAFLQASDSPFKNYFSPLLILFCGLFVLGGAFMSNAPADIGIVSDISLMLSTAVL